MVMDIFCKSAIVAYPNSVAMILFEGVRGLRYALFGVWR